MDIVLASKLKGITLLELCSLKTSTFLTCQLSSLWKIAILLLSHLKLEFGIQKIKMKISHLNKLFLWPLFPIPMFLEASNIWSHAHDLI